MLIEGFQTFLTLSGRVGRSWAASPSAPETVAKSGAGAMRSGSDRVGEERASVRAAGKPTYLQDRAGVDSRRRGPATSSPVGAFANGG